MALQIKLSKTDFTKGKQCQKALWLDYYKLELKPNLDNKTKNILETGEEINDLARSYFKDGANAAIDESDNSHARIDILQKNEGKKS